MKKNHYYFTSKRLLPLSFGIIASLLLSFPLQADDTEIFFSSSTKNSTTRPNILLLLDTSGSMGNKDNKQSSTRMQLMQAALNSIIDKSTNVNIGLARFTNPGGAVVFPVQHVDDNVCTTTETCIPATKTVLVRDRLKKIIGNFTTKDFTPLVSSMYEAALYFRGDAVDFGVTRGPSDSRFKRVSHPATYTGGTVAPANCADSDLKTCKDEKISGNPIYTSPITTDCQNNHLVVLSDGIANRTNNTKVLNLINANNGTDPNVSCDTKVPDTGAQCGKELAAFLKNYDQSSTYIKSKITTHTIGFAADINNNPQFKQYMQDIAIAGGGLFKPANSTAELVTAFTEILNAAGDSNSSFSIPSIKVNQVNRIANSEEIYMALFKPTSTQNWSGNIKRYSLRPNNADVLTVYDANNQPAIDLKSLTFKKTSRSYWGSITDGNTTTKGGAAGQLTNSRTIYSNLSSSKNLTATSNLFNNTNIKFADVSAADDTELDTIISWVTGTDNGGVKDTGDYIESTLTGRQQMGAPLHSEPVLISYDDNLTIPDTTLYFGTNEGYLHAIDTDDGKEIFAFMPKILLKNLKSVKDNTTNTTKAPVYGVDGPISVWQYDADNNKKITGSNANADLSDDHVILYTGLRRGGRNYFALDVTNRTSPKILWSIDNNTVGFENLGQTWSRPVVATIDLSSLTINGDTGETKVVIFTGGYDPAQDSKPTRIADTMGSSIYIVNALTGNLIWSGGSNATNFKTSFPEMNYSIPSNLAVIDVNQDNVADLMYVGDMGGQLWRFDFNSNAAGTSGSVSDLVTGGVIADINSGSVSGNRRFYNPPDIALINGASGRYLAIALGTGYRAHPLDTAVENRFYVIKDKDYNYILSSYTKATELTLYDATANLIQEGGNQASRDSASASLRNADGWFIKIENFGEKVLSTALTFENNIVFTTYQPETAQNVSACKVSVGTGRFYFMSIVDATPVVKLANAPLPSRTNRVKTLRDGALPPSPQPVFTKDNIRVLVGTEELPINIKNKILKTHWRVKD